MKNVTGKFVRYPNNNPPHTPASASPTDQAIIFGTVLPKNCAVDAGSVNRMNTNIEPTICEPTLTLIASTIKKITLNILVGNLCACAPR